MQRINYDNRVKLDWFGEWIIFCERFFFFKIIIQFDRCGMELSVMDLQDSNAVQFGKVKLRWKS